jgi:hypothetical protein
MVSFNLCLIKVFLDKIKLVVDDLGDPFAICAMSTRAPSSISSSAYLCETQSRTRRLVRLERRTLSVSTLPCCLS